MRKAKGTVGNWNATVSPGGEILACIHLNFCCNYNAKTGEFTYLEDLKNFTGDQDPQRNADHVEKIKKDKLAILTRSDIEKDPETDLIKKISRKDYIGIAEISEAEFINDSQIKIKGRLVERLQ